MPKPKTVTHSGTAQVFRPRIGVPKKGEDEPSLIEETEVTEEQVEEVLSEEPQEYEEEK